MPEGDTVHQACARLHAALAGRVLTTADLRVPRHATADLAGRRVREVVPRGKHLLVRLDGDVTLHNHLRMDGAWHLARPGAPWRGGPGHQVRVVLGNDEQVAVGYRLHDVRLVRTAEEGPLVGHLGPDVLGADWDPAEAARRLAAAGDTGIGEALLDQGRLAGVGNVYKAESLFLRGLSPWTPAGQVTGADLDALVATVHRLMLANRDRPARSTTGDPRPGRTAWVYGRRSCLRCGTAVRVAGGSRGAGGAPGERVTYWCPNCQPGPTPAAPGRR